MSRTVTCSRCEKKKEALESAPTGGAMGQLVLERVCRDCWAEWREASAQIINHYGLVLGDPHTREQLRHAMREFLGLVDSG